MVVRIRLARFGRKHRPFYRIVVADARSPRDGRHLERVGTYDPLPGKDGIKEVRLRADRIRYWMACGAQPTSKVAWLLGKAGILPEQPRPEPVAARRNAAPERGSVFRDEARIVEGRSLRRKAPQRLAVGAVDMPRVEAEHARGRREPRRHVWAQASLEGSTDALFVC